MKSFQEHLYASYYIERCARATFCHVIEMELRGKKKNVHVWLVFGYNEGCLRVIKAPLSFYIPDAEENNLPNDLCTQNSDYTHELENSYSSRIIFFPF